jgi:type I restriction enzyme R subunit
MDADEFRDYILGFIFYKYLSEKMKAYADDILEADAITYQSIDESSDEGKRYLEAIREEAVESLGYFLKPSELFSSVARRGNGNGKHGDTFILEDLQRILNNIEQSTMGTESEDQLVTFVDFDYTELWMTGQQFEDYKSKYLDLYDKVRTATNKEKVSILEDVDFEVELIHRDEINVRYILTLLSIYHDKGDAEKERIRKQIADLLSSEIKLRSKRELILEFIDSNMPNISDADMINDEFDEFWTKKQREAFERLCQEEGIKAEALQQIIADYLFTDQKPMPDVIIRMLERKPKVLERRPIIERITRKIINFVDVFINGIGEY